MSEAQATAADYARALEKGVAWLRFDPQVEAEFRHSHVLRVRIQARFWQSFQLAMGFFGLNVIRVGAAREETFAFLMACVGVHLTVSSILVATVYGSAYAGSYLRLAALLTPFRAAATAVIVAYIIHTGGSGTAVMTINMFGLLFFSGLMLRQAIPSAVTMIVVFAAALAGFGVHTALATYSVTSLLVVFGLAVSSPGTCNVPHGPHFWSTDSPAPTRREMR